MARFVALSFGACSLLGACGGMATSGSNSGADGAGGASAGDGFTAVPPSRANLYERRGMHRRPRRAVLRWAAEDECIDDDDCGAAGSGAYCMYDPLVRRWVCRNTHCIG